MNKPKISAIICTYNNARLLRPALDSLLNQTLKPQFYEVVVVDNASSDETRFVVDSYLCKPVSVRYIYERKQGLSAARNRGVTCAHSDYIAFLDDDARPKPDWLERILWSFEHVDPKPDIVGGRVLLDYQDGWVPGYVKGVVEIYLSGLDHGKEGHFLNEGRRLLKYLNGTNLAMCRTLINKIGYFDEMLGRKGRLLLSYEDSEYLERAAAKGYNVYYEPTAIVEHYVSRRNLRRLRILQRFFWQGYSFELSRKRSLSADFHVFREVVNRLRKLIDRIFELIKGRSFISLADVCMAWGELWGDIARKE